jgi:signal transduction histidine kinase/ActR/RegA family two-component response regulator
MRTIPEQEAGSGPVEARDENAGSSAGRELSIEDLHQALALERRARMAAEAANHAKDEFLSVVSHELRSPLNAILGWTRILAIKCARDAEVTAITPRIEQSARAQLKMVNDLLDFGRIGTGKLRISLRPVKLSLLAPMAVDAARPAAEAKGVTLALDLGPPGALIGDSDRLMQVISNLLSNAIKFTPAGGRITVKLRETAGRIELSVTDTGIGIGADLLPHIFDRFTQGDSSTTRGAGGLGLGLTLVREILALHGGTVSAYSDGENCGSKFVVSLPAQSDADRSDTDGVDLQPSSAPTDGRARRLMGLRVLVVDDEPDASAVVAEALRFEGASVAVAGSAPAALAQLVDAANHFDVLVTDIGMPDEDGYSLVRRLRRLQSRENVVAIALTGYASPADVESALQAGFDLHVPKPVDFDSFVPTIQRLASFGAATRR